MEFFNIGSGELLFLVLLAILVVGPKRSVQLMQQAGRLLARLQREWRTIQRDIMTEVQAVRDEVSLEPISHLTTPPRSVGRPSDEGTTEETESAEGEAAGQSIGEAADTSKGGDGTATRRDAPHPGAR